MDKAPFPHCDSNVLHRPGTCMFCDHYPEEQNARIKAGINFTGDGPDPATDVRDLDSIQRWHGNRPITQEEWDKETERWNAEMDRLLGDPDA